MTDLEITRLCAEAMGGKVTHDLPRGHKGEGWIRLDRVIFSPLTNDEQAMALVKRFGMEIHCRTDRNGWHVGIVESDGMVPHGNLNRAICECVAKMQAAA